MCTKTAFLAGSLCGNNVLRGVFFSIAGLNFRDLCVTGLNYFVYRYL